MSIVRLIAIIVVEAFTEWPLDYYLGEVSLFAQSVHWYGKENSSIKYVRLCFFRKRHAAASQTTNSTI